DEYINNLDLILEKDIKNLKGLYLYGLCLLQREEWENAAVVFDNLTELGDEGIKLAREGLEEGRRLAPESVEIIKSLIGVMEKLGRFNDALGLVEEVASSGEADSLVELVPKLDHIVKRAPELAPRAERLYEIIKEVDPFLSTLAAAEARAASRDYEKAVTEYKKALEIDPEKREMIENIIAQTLEGYPDAGPITLFLARLYIKDGKMKEASDLFLKAHKRNPELVAELIDDYYQIIKDYPKDPSLRRVLVDALFTKKMFDQVLKEAKEAIESLGGKEKGYFLLKSGQALVEKGSLSDAVRPIMLSLDSDPSLVGDVINSLDHIVSIDQHNIPAHFALGRAYGVAKKIDKAVDELMLTARIVPTRVDRIIEELERLKSYSPASGLPYYARGFLYINNNRVKEGVEELDRAL
ncbi:MAG TPA: tetratricopeptide repeat protein, partial [bacterium (Candidatus Stahlbacteria)]|nr:tetratricopeptide repeat protein [Candidatus Stahlbacteria bacterium]